MGSLGRTRASDFAQRPHAVVLGLVVGDRSRNLTLGNADLTLTVEARSNDEPGELAEPLNRFVGQIRSSLTLIAEQVEQLERASPTWCGPRPRRPARCAVPPRS